MAKTISVDQYIMNNSENSVVLNMLREIMLSCGMEETVKWGMPVYTVDGKNITGLGSFKSYVGIWFYQGGLLKDKHKKLINAQENKTNAMRQMRFGSENEIDIDLVKSYVIEAIENQKAGKEIKPVKNKELKIPQELEEAFDRVTGLKESFERFNLSHKREFAEYVSEAKKEETRLKRLEFIIMRSRVQVPLSLPINKKRFRKTSKTAFF